MQQRPPRLLFGPLRGLVLALTPLLVGTGLARRAARSVFQRFANGVTDVRLCV